MGPIGEENKKNLAARLRGFFVTEFIGNSILHEMLFSETQMIHAVSRENARKNYTW